MQFTKVASDGDVDVYQAMTTVEGKPKPNGDAVAVETPLGFDRIDGFALKSIAGAFKGREIVGLSLSLDGASVRVRARVCPKCDATPADDDAYCRACGTDLSKESR